MSRCERRPSLVEAAVRMVRIDCAVRPSRPMTLPTSSLATRSSMSRLCSPSISVTSTESGSSTRALAMVSINSFNAMLRLRFHRIARASRIGSREHWEAYATLGGLLRGATFRRGRSDGGYLLLLALVGFEQPVERVGRLCAAAAPVVEAFAVQDESTRIPGGIVGAELLDETAPAGAALIGHDDAVEGRLLGADAAQTYVNGHRLSFALLSRPLTSEL